MVKCDDCNYQWHVVENGISHDICSARSLDLTEIGWVDLEYDIPCDEFKPYEALIIPAHDLLTYQGLPLIWINQECKSNMKAFILNDGLTKIVNLVTGTANENALAEVFK